MFFWTKYPFVRLTIFFILGILAGINWPDYEARALVILLLTIVLYTIIFYFKKRFLLSRNYLYGISISLIFVLLGYVSVCLKTPGNAPINLVNQPEIEAYRARVISEPESSGDFLRVKLEVNMIKDSVWKEANGKVIAYLKGHEEVELEYGDELILIGEPVLVKPPLNPAEFNYKQYLLTLGITHQHFVKANNWHISKSSANLSLRGASIRVRNTLEGVLDKHIPNPDARAIAKALILGNKEELSEDTRNIFAEAGAMHVLAVSGLHVGIIYMVLILILNQRREKVRSPVLVALVIIPTLWFYAFITGLSPSVLRAVTMFSLLALGQSLNRKTSSFNTLAISALILLWLDPYLVFSVGFQLSYIAVTGILFFYPIIENWFVPKNKILLFFWQITALSLAAQLVTAPISAFYFHRFPTYFILTNLVVIPAASLIVWCGLSLLLFGSISTWVGGVIGAILSFIIKLMSYLLSVVTQLPGASLENLAPDRLDLLLGYSLIVVIATYLLVKTRLAFRLILFVLALLIGKNIVSEYQREQRNQIVFYSIPRGYAIDLIKDGHFVSIADSGLTRNTIKYRIEPYRTSTRITPRNQPATIGEEDELGKIVVWQGYKILIASSCFNDSAIPPVFDFVLKQPGGRNSECYYDQILLRKLVDNDGIHFERHSLKESGAYIVNL